jgi:Ca2+-binding EF-hand superfamily protein
MPTYEMYAHQAIFKNRRELAVVFRLLDLNGDGKLGQDEVKKACGMLNKNLPEGRKIDAEDLFSIMDANEDGAVSVDDFCECWRQAQ